MYVRRGVEEEVEEEVEDLEEEVARDEDEKKVELDGSIDKVEHDSETEESAASEILTGAERA